MGVIDESYCGDNDQWHFPAYALRDTVIHVNDRICQFRIMEHQPKIIFEETEKLDNKDRGRDRKYGKELIKRFGKKMKQIKRLKREKVSLFLAAAVLSLGILSGCGGESKGSERARMTGIEQLNAGNYQDAIDSFGKALDESDGIVNSF